MLRAQRIKITEAGWASFTGHLGTVEFVNGVSKGLVAPVQIAQLGSMIRIEGLDDREQAGYAATLAQDANKPAEVKEELPRMTEEELSAPVVAKGKNDKTPGQALNTYTQEDLEKIADANGIAGLRDIAEEYGLKGRSIRELIAEILAAQAKREG